MNTTLRYILTNGIFLAALLAGVYGEIGWLQKAVVVFVWLMLASYLAVFTDAGRRKEYQTQTNRYPLALGATIDAFALVIILNEGWFVTAAAYAISAAIEIALYGRHRLFRWTPNQ